jgi:hypothetical protein
MTVDEFFAGQPEAMRFFKSVCRVIDTFGDIELRLTKSQIAFRRGKSFAWVWMPGKYLHGRPVAPLVLTVSLPYRDPSPRWKQVVEPYPGRTIHHLELNNLADVDEEVCGWLRAAWNYAGGSKR